MAAHVIPYEAKSEPKCVRLKLSRSSGGTRVCIVDEEGEVIPGGWLLEIQDAGTFYRIDSVSFKTGLQLNSAGQIVERV